MPLPLVAGLFLTVTGLVALCFGPYALLRGGRSQRSGIGPLSERGVHALEGIRMTAIGAASLGLGLYALWSYF